MSKTVPQSVLAGAVAAAAALAAAPAQADDEICHGVALAREHDCAAGPGTTCAGAPKADGRGDAWSLAPEGTCTTMELPGGRRGATRETLTAKGCAGLARDLPPGTGTAAPKPAEPACE